MKIGFSTNAFTKKPLTYAIESIGDIGYDGIELVLDTPHAFLPIKKSRLEIIKKYLNKNKLQVANLNVNTVVGWHHNDSSVEKFEPSLSNMDEKLRNWRLNYTKQAIDLAQELGAPSISITSGVAQNSEREKNIFNFKKSIQELSSYAEKKNILIGVEYEPGLLIGSVEDLVPLISDSYRNLGVNFDSCHAAVLNENIPTVIRKLNQKLFHIHLSDCKDRVHYHLIPSLGQIDFKSMYQALVDVNYKGFLTAELYPYFDEPEEAAKKALNYLRKLVN